MSYKIIVDSCGELTEDMKAVSYTHLDVYKRQGQENGSRVDGKISIMLIFSDSF